MLCKRMPEGCIFLPSFGDPQDLTSQMWSAIAASRGMTLEELTSAVSRAPLLAAAALREGVSAAAGTGLRGSEGRGRGGSVESGGGAVSGVGLQGGSAASVAEGPEQGSTGAGEDARLADAPTVPPPEQLPPAPLLDGLKYKDEVCGVGSTLLLLGESFCLMLG